MQPKFSIVLIARNESKTLPRLVGSLSEFKARGGEICLLDTGSTDNTANIARTMGCKVEEVGDRFRVVIDEDLANKINDKFIVEGEEPIVKAGESLFDYSSARNYAATLASNDMIATPDCDEIWTMLNIDALNTHIEQGVTQFEYNFVFSHDEFGRPVIQFMHSKFYDRRALKWTGIIHETLTGVANTIYVPETIAKLEHYQNVETNRSHYLTGLALDCFENPTHDRNCHYFARELMFRGRFKSAIREFERHLSMNRMPVEMAQSVMFIGDCHFHLGNAEESIAFYLKSFNREPRRREPLMKIAEHFSRKQWSAETIMFVEAALRITSPINYYAIHQPYYEHVPHELLYWAYWHIGDKEKSKEHFYKALALCPENPKFLADKSWYEEIPSTGNLEFTGERMIPGKMAHRPDIEREHMARYKFARDFVQGQTVVDAACGSGYGKEVLDNANHYYGLDISPEAIKYAKETYNHKDFYVADLEKAGLDTEFNWNIPHDTVVSFETIEHLENPDAFLSWVRDNSKMFVFSIPVNMPSEFHKQVYSVDQIKALIAKYFPHVYFYGQIGDIISGDFVDTAQYIVGVAFTKLPSLSIIIPTLGREEGLKRCLQSIDDLIYPEALIQTITIEDEPRMGVPKRLKQGVESSNGEWIIYASNDIKFTPASVFNAITSAEDMGYDFVAFNTGEVSEDEGNICEHFAIKRSLIPLLGGEIFDTEFHHVGVDNLLWAKLKKLDKEFRCEEAIIEHFHWSKTGEEMDEVYKLAWNEDTVASDRALLKVKLTELNK